MPSIHNLSPDERADLMGRLRKIEGQAKGIQRMIDEGRDCLDIINQLASVKAAVNAVSGELLEAYTLHCMRHPEDFSTPERAVEEAVRALVRAGR
ncbi:MAG: metal-sensitive transcriptional regulator [Thermomicrobiales bacterium]|nr:metal-sensitive transcriptional regulator [Thermomicrobiales bacterium]